MTDTPAASGRRGYTSAAFALFGAVLAAAVSTVVVSAVAGVGVAELVASPASTRWNPGVGLTSMRERAAELGGTVDAGPRGFGGRVSARLPL